MINVLVHCSCILNQMTIIMAMITINTRNPLDLHITVQCVHITVQCVHITVQYVQITIQCVQITVQCLLHFTVRYLLIQSIYLT